MKAVLCILVVCAAFSARAQQSPSPTLPAFTQEERRGDIVCTVYRNYGSPDVVTISGSGNTDFSKQDIAGCVQAVKQKLKRLEESINQQSYKKSS